MSSIILYFSRSGNNYVNGCIENLTVGNTEIAAQMIQQLTGADIFKIEPATEYSKDYSECIEQAKRDLQHELRPELKEYPKDLSSYEIIYLGYPNYWGTMPMAVFSLLEKYDWSNKIIKPFCTHEGSGIGRSEADIKKICSGAVVKKGLELRGATVKNAEDIIKKWI